MVRGPIGTNIRMTVVRHLAENILLICKNKCIWMSWLGHRTNTLFVGGLGQSRAGKQVNGGVTDLEKCVLYVSPGSLSLCMETIRL